MHYLQLGASLYVPATRGDLAEIGNGLKHSLRSVIYCTEDAVAASELSLALANLERALRRLEPAPLLRFVRVRDPFVLRQVLQMTGARQLAGFVLPKLTRRNVDDYYDAFAKDDAFAVMPTLETVEVFDVAEMSALRDQLLHEPYRRRLLSLRIGGNDLLQLLGLRRPRRRSIYATPLGAVIAQLVTIFRPHGLNLTAPVFEGLRRPEVLAREARRDLAFGLFGKSAIHPEQVPVIEAQYAIARAELNEADTILAPGAAPVFRLNGAMCEPATHRAWALLIRERAHLYGIREVDAPSMASALVG
jgi:citrate lyase beta subunit